MIKSLTTEARSYKTVVVSHTSSLLFFRALLEEDLPQNILLLVERVVVLDIVVVGLVEHTI